MADKYGFDPLRPLILFTQHPVTTEYKKSAEQYYTTIEALSEFPDSEVIAIYSNTDAGGREIIEIMKQSKQFHIFPNITSQDFVAIMSCADLMVGNSSAAIREAPSFKLPAVNLGSRQNGRMRAENVIDVPHDTKAIVNAIEMALHNEDFKEKLSSVVNPYGDGNSAKRIVDILQTISLDDNLIQKRINY